MSLGQKALRSGRVARLAKLGGMAAGLVRDSALAAGTLPAGVSRAERALHERFARTLRDSFGELKGLPMKIGQMLSYVDDLIPPEHREIYRRTLGELQARTVPVDWESMRGVLLSELGRQPEEVFAQLDTTPIAAASIGQVYRGRLADGSEVAIKVQYPGIDRAIGSDLANVGGLVRVMRLVLPGAEVRRIFDEVSTRLAEECDYVHEAASQEAFRERWADDPTVRIPRVFTEHSSRRVLVTELVRGRSFDEFVRGSTDEARSEAGRIIFRFVFRSLYGHGIFNADPHPGNYLFDRSGEVVFLDFGCVQTFDRETIDSFARLRQLIVAGVEGPALREPMTRALGLSDDLDDTLLGVATDYIKLSMRALRADQPFRFGRDHTEEIARSTMETKLAVMKSAWRGGLPKPENPGMVFLGRINFGLMSILSALGAEADWREMLQEIDREAGRAV